MKTSYNVKFSFSVAPGHTPQVLKGHMWTVAPLLNSAEGELSIIAVSSSGWHCPTMTDLWTEAGLFSLLLCVLFQYTFTSAEALLKTSV